MDGSQVEARWEVCSRVCLISRVIGIGAVAAEATAVAAVVLAASMGAEALAVGMGAVAAVATEAAAVLAVAVAMGVVVESVPVHFQNGHCLV